jgi:hypothetical protein
MHKLVIAPGWILRVFYGLAARLGSAACFRALAFRLVDRSVFVARIFQDGAIAFAEIGLQVASDLDPAGVQFGKADSPVLFGARRTG